MGRTQGFANPRWAGAIAPCLNETRPVTKGIVTPRPLSAAWRWARSRLWASRAGLVLISFIVPPFIAFAGAAEVRLAVSQGPVSLPIYVAESEGYFAEAGVGVRLLACSSGRHCFQMLTSRQADLATAAELMVTLDALQGAGRDPQAAFPAASSSAGSSTSSRAGSDSSTRDKVRGPDPAAARAATGSAIIATLSASTRHIKLVARSDAGIRQASDLRGKRIASVTGTSAQYFLDNWLIFHQIDPQEVRLNALPPDQLVPALLSGDVDAIAIWEPIASQAIGLLAERAIVLQNPRVYTQHFSLIGLRSTLQQREADVLKVLNALVRSERFIAQHPVQAERLLKRWMPQDGARVDLSEHDFNLRLPQSLIATMEAQARWAQRQGLGRLPGGPGGVMRSIEPSLLRRAAPGSVELVN